MTHTKGPWAVTPNSGEIGTSDGKVWVARAVNATTTEGQSNAHLIAAAPELLALLKASADIMEALGLDCSDERAAIAKAEGRT